jgi:methylmalonyl-CoA mutase
VASAVWARFQQIEASGGAVQALADGLFASWVADAVVQRDRDLATRSRPLTGVSMFPLVGEVTPDRRPRVHLPTAAGGFAPRRDATAYEALRDRARELGGPAVVVHTLGTRRDFGARQAFVTNLLAAGGISAVQEGAKVAILASSRAGYAEHGASAIEALRAAGVDTVLVAGRAGELGESAGAVDGEVHDGIDVVAFLSDVLDRLAPRDAGTTTEGSR